MNNFDFAHYLSMKGYDVYEKEGVDVEALLFGETDYNVRPINYDELKKAAEKEGFVLSNDYWIEERYNS